MAFHDTSTKAHDDAWAATVAAFQPHMSKGLEFHHDVPMLKTKLQLAAVRLRVPASWDGERGGASHRIWTPQKDLDCALMRWSWMRVANGSLFW
eukprot:1458079-Rhodomonas_salina.2